MNANMSAAEEDAKSILESLGFAAEKVPTTSKRSADFRVGGDDPPYLVEVKSRLLQPELENPTEPIGPEITKPMRYDAKVGDWLAESRQQFRALDPEHERLWFLWCSMEGAFARLSQAERTMSVLYGLRLAVDVTKPDRTLPIFYAAAPAFERFPDVDGAVVVLPGTSLITFCPNETSPRFTTVMSSKLVRSLREKGVGAMLPIERAVLGGGYVVPPEVRSLEHVAVLRHTQIATGRRYLNFMALEEEWMLAGKISLLPSTPDGAVAEPASSDPPTPAAGPSQEIVMVPGEDCPVTPRR